MTDLYDSIVLKDIFWRGQVRDVDALNRLLEHIVIELFADIFSNIDCQVF